jgi:hypothetical protein
MGPPITEAPPASWDEEELRQLKASYSLYGFNEPASKYNPKPGSLTCARGYPCSSAG